MTFLFKDEGISKVWYQITQETTISLSADMWGLLDATYHPGPVANASQLRDAFAQELDGRFPTKPIEDLAHDYPGVDISAFGRGVSSRNMTWYGFVINGVNYLSGCQTRYGEYPYCEYMRAPSYSTAKSAFVSIETRTKWGQISNPKITLTPSCEKSWLQTPRICIVMPTAFHRYAPVLSWSPDCGH